MRTGKKFLSSRKLYILNLMAANASLQIATLRGPSVVEMVKMIVDSEKSGDYDITVYDEPLQLLAEMASGKLDFAVLPTGMSGLLQAKGIGYHIAAIMVWGGLYVCGTDKSIASINDLKGRTIYVMGGNTPPEMMLHRLIKAAGMEPETDVRFDRSYPTHKDLSKAAEDGLAELCILSEPFVSQALEANGNLHILLDIGKEWKAAEGSLPPVTAFFCKDSLDCSCNNAVEHTVAALHNSCEWVKNNPEEAAEAVVDLGLFNNKKAIQASINHSYFDVIPYLYRTEQMK